MDQILGFNVSTSVQIPEVKQGGVFARLNPLHGIVDKFFAPFIDVNLFIGSGRSLFVWRRLMSTLTQYQITNEKTYLDVEKDTILFLEELANTNQHITQGMDRLSPGIVRDLLVMMKYKSGLFSLPDLPIYVRSRHCFLETSASEYLFVLIKNSDYLATQLSDTNQKRVIGNFLVHALNIERDEYTKIRRTFSSSYLLSSYTSDVEPRECELRTFLRYMSLETLSDHVAFEKIVESLMEEIQNFRNINIEFFPDSGSRSSSSSISPTVRMRLSPWFIVAACRMYLISQNIWRKLDKTLTNIFDHNVSELNRRNSSSSSSSENGDGSQTRIFNYYVFSIEKRMCESCLKLCLLETFLPNSVGDYEATCASLRINTVPSVMQLLYNIPLVISWGCCIDRYSLVDETFRLNVRKVMSITKDEIESVLEQKGIHVRELGGYDTIEFTRNLFQSAEKSVRSVIHRTLRHTIGSAMTIFENEIYTHLFSLGHVANVTLPLLFSIFIEAEFLSYADAHTPMYARSLIKYMLYALFPLMLSSTTETQYKIKRLLYELGDTRS